MPSASDWRAELSRLGPHLTLREGVTRAALLEAQTALRWRFPADLADFLRATDGVYDEDAHHEYAWCLTRLVAENLAQRDELPPDLLGVGDDAAGHWFCLSKTTGEAIHAGATLTPVAPDLRGLWRAWFGRRLNV
jgi:hypothetical protein